MFRGEMWWLFWVQFLPNSIDTYDFKDKVIWRPEGHQLWDNTVHVTDCWKVTQELCFSRILIALNVECKHKFSSATLGYSEKKHWPLWVIHNSWYTTNCVWVVFMLQGKTTVIFINLRILTFWINQHILPEILFSITQTWWLVSLSLASGQIISLTTVISCDFKTVSSPLEMAGSLVGLPWIFIQLIQCPSPCMPTETSIVATLKPDNKFRQSKISQNKLNKVCMVSI